MEYIDYYIILAAVFKLSCEVAEHVFCKCLLKGTAALFISSQSSERNRVILQAAMTQQSHCKFHSFGVGGTVILTEKPNPDKKRDLILSKKTLLAPEKNACY